MRERRDSRDSHGSLPFAWALRPAAGAPQAAIRAAWLRVNKIRSQRGNICLSMRMRLGRFRSGTETKRIVERAPRDRPNYRMVSRRNWTALAELAQASAMVTWAAARCGGSDARGRSGAWARPARAKAQAARPDIPCANARDPIVCL